jgi:A/G-specific adenine glycosylase
LRSKEFARRLSYWFRAHARDFAWRKTKDPYQILVAEMMLQKTTSKQVSECFRRFIEKYPTTESLAKATISEIEEMIKPLGLEHVRAYRFKKWAEAVVDDHGGKIPKDRNELMQLAGVGNYIANSVLILAFDVDLPLLDTNAVRVLNRVLEIKSSKASATDDKELWRKVGQIIPKGKTREFNLGLIDFGALVCTARKPKCGICPMTDLCLFYASCVKPRPRFPPI